MLVVARFSKSVAPRGDRRHQDPIGPEEGEESLWVEECWKISVAAGGFTGVGIRWRDGVGWGGYKKEVGVPRSTLEVRLDHFDTARSVWLSAAVCATEGMSN